MPRCQATLWLRDEQCLYDVLGPGFRLIRRDPKLDIGRLSAAAIDRGVPFAVVDMDADQTATLYPRKLTLVRPDQHIAWRGDQLPDDPGALVDRVRGAPLVE